MEIWIPDRMYGMMPWLCIAAGSVAMSLLNGLVVVGCSLYLFGYAATVLWRRCLESCRYS